MLRSFSPEYPKNILLADIPLRVISVSDTYNVFVPKDMRRTSSRVLLKYIELCSFSKNQLNRIKMSKRNFDLIIEMINTLVSDIVQLYKIRLF
jgi:hypothetical protein